MIRTQIQLEESQHEKLKALAARRSTSISHLIREGVDQILAMAEEDPRWSRLWEVVGAFHDRDGATDVAVDHDPYLREVYSGE